MKSYKIIEDISQSLYINLQNESDVEERLKNSMHKIHSGIYEDFKLIFGFELSLKDAHIYVDDIRFKQSATGIVLEEVIENNEEYQINVECLIDFGKISIKVKKGEEITKFRDITYRIKRAQNMEGISELKEIK